MRCVGAMCVDTAVQSGCGGDELGWQRGVGGEETEGRRRRGGVAGVRDCWEHAAERGEASTNSWKRATTILYRQLSSSSSSSSSFQLFLSPLFSLSVMFLYY